MRLGSGSVVPGQARRRRPHRRGDRGDGEGRPAPGEV